MNSKQNGGRRLDGYIRVSDVHGREGDSFISPDLQRDKIAAWATIHNHEVSFLEPELDVSGGKLKRPVLDRIMARIRSGETDGIAIARLDRFSRAGVGDALALIEEIKKVGGVFGCVEPQIDTSDPVMGEFILTIFLALARMERQRIRVNWADSKARAVGRGIHVSAQVPFGYIRPRGEANPRTARRPTLPLQVDPDAAPIVKELFQRRASGESWGRLRDWLEANHVPTVRGAAWQVSTVQGMIRNRVYLGFAAGSPDDLPGGVAEAHPSLVDEATWHAAQPRTGMRTSKNPPTTLLRGLARCGSCRFTLTAQKNPGGAYQYVCDRASKGCRQPALIQAVAPNGGLALDDVVTELMWEHLDEVVFEGYDQSLDLEALETERDELVARRERDAEDSELEEALGRAGWVKRLAGLTAKIDDAQARIEETLRQIGRPQGRPLAELRADWESGAISLEEKRRHAAGAIQAVFVKPTGGIKSLRRKDLELRRRDLEQRIHIRWARDPELLDEIPRQGKGGFEIRPWTVWPDPDPDVSGPVLLQPPLVDAGDAVG